MSKFVPKNYYEAYLKNEEYGRPSEEDIVCETQLNSLSVHEKLIFEVDTRKFEKQIVDYDDNWIPYLPRAIQNNNREGLLLWGLKGDSCGDSMSLPEARIRSDNPNLKESECKFPTEFYKHMECLHPMCEYFAPLGRSYIIKMNAGDYFPPHKDHPLISRDCFRIACFFGDVQNFHWQTDDQKLNIVPGNWYYIDTRKIHRTNHYGGGSSYHVILNIPKTWDNVLKLMSVSSV